MRVAVLGRSKLMLGTARLLHDAGHEIGLVGTCRAEAFYRTDEHAFEAFAEDVGAPFFNDARINSAERVADLRRFGCEIAVSVNWLTVLSAAACAAFPRGVLNAHAGDLPRFRGNACPNWAILTGEPHVGLCIHQMEPGELDSGPVFLRDRFPLDAATYIGDVHAWLERRIPEMILETIEELERGTIEATPQPTDPSAAPRCHPRRPEDARILWRSDAETISRLVRASSRPLDGAYCFLEGERRVTVWRASVAEADTPFLAESGQVLGADTEGCPLIACNDGTLRLEDIEIEDGRGHNVARVAVLKSLRQRVT